MYGKNEEHLQNLNIFLITLEEAGMKLHPDKRKFLKLSIEYLDHLTEWIIKGFTKWNQK